MSLEHFGHARMDARRKLGERLGILRSRRRTGEPARVVFAELGLDLSRRLSFPLPEPTLAEALVDLDLEAERLRQDLRRLAGPREVAAVHDVDVAQLSGQFAGLLAAGVIQR